MAVKVSRRRRRRRRADGEACQDGSQPAVGDRCPGDRAGHLGKPETLQRGAEEGGVIVRDQPSLRQLTRRSASLAEQA